MTGQEISVRHLSKMYRVPEREEGMLASLQSLWRRSYRSVQAVRDISFSLGAGEIVGFLGPNGAGKTSTLKMLAGLLYPTKGEVRVAGYTPWRREREYLRRISMVLGNKSQVLWDIPPRDSFRIQGEIYGVPRSQLQCTLNELYDLLDMRELLTRPTRTFSLGERMKCELVMALLYRPRVLFLDEPTLGLDVAMQNRLRRFIAEYNHRTGATVILTSHYMADVVALCARVIVIHHGQLLYDGGLRELVGRVAPYKTIRLLLNTSDEEQVTPCFPAPVTLVSHEDATWTLSIPQSEVPGITQHLLQALPVVDLSIEDPPIENVIEQIYQGGAL